jgi:hypothetical protein
VSFWQIALSEYYAEDQGKGNGSKHAGFEIFKLGWLARTLA